MMDFEKRINERIKEIMCEKGYNQSELADITGIAQSTISAILRGASMAFSCFYITSTWAIIKEIVT